MYPRFIELHWNTIPVSYNVENISWFGDKFIYIVGQDTALDVDESYDELKSLIKDCGCLIHKQDPRLDTTHPLTMDDLREMIGEPVWNSNDRHWYLVWLINELDTDRPVHLRYRDGVMLSMSADDLMKYPLYRMKQESLVDKLNEVRRKK